MAEYIERAELMKFPIRIDHYDEEHGNVIFVYGVETVLEYAENIPAADVAPVVHGRWVAKNGRIVCDHCEALMAVCPNRDVLEENLKYFNEKEKFCYNCGARMDGE